MLVGRSLHVKLNSELVRFRRSGLTILVYHLEGLLAT
jgi:hypothetical protein